MADMFSQQIAQRLVQALNASRWKQAELAEQIGVSTAAVSKWFRSGQVATEHLPKLASILGVSLEWLLTGEGEIRPVAAQTRDSPTFYLTDDEARLLEYLRWLTPAQREKLLTEAKETAESNRDVVEYHSKLKSA